MNNQSTNNRSDLICFWGGYTFFPMYMIGFVFIAGFFPIPSPDMDAFEVAALFNENQFKILSGMALTIIASALLIPWAGAVFSQMLRVDHGNKLLSYMQLIAGALGVVFFMVPSVLWSILAFRSHFDPGTMQVLNDFSWILWCVSYPPYVIQFVAFGLCVLFQDTNRILFPRWLAYLSFWLGIALLPASLVVFFKTGPFAWNGVIAIYIPFVLFTIWFNLVSFYVYKAIKTKLPT